MRVGIFSEGSNDTELLYVPLLKGLLSRDFELVPMRYSGWTWVLRQLHVALDSFEGSSVDFAFVAVDDDCERPTHALTHERDPDVHGCRKCALENRTRVRADGAQRALRTAVAVPAPSIEAWLLAVRDPEAHDPELAKAHQLKARLYGIANATRWRVEERGRPLAERLGRDLETRDRVARTCGSFAAFLRSLELAAQVPLLPASVRETVATESAPQSPIVQLGREDTQDEQDTNGPMAEVE